MSHLRKPARTPAGHAVKTWWASHTSEERWFLWGALIGLAVGLALMGFLTWVNGL